MRKFVVIVSTLSMVILAFEIFAISNTSTGFNASHKVYASLLVQEFPLVLIAELLAFVLVLLLLHAAIALYACFLRRWLACHGGLPADAQDGLALGVFVAVWAAVLLWNSLLYPSSLMAYPAFELWGIFGQRELAILLSLLAASPLLLLPGVLLRTVSRVLTNQFHRPAAAFSLAMLSLGLVVTFSSRPQATSTQANIILIGVDSLRGDMLHDRALLPDIAGFIDGAALFEQTYTPLARTFPSWVSMLSGRHPRNSGARANLVDPAQVERDGLISESLREVGYRTVYATDERRFSNLDESYGFEENIGPSAGAADFVFGLIGDTPLSNVVANMAVGKYLFPYLHANRAITHLYEPSRFNASIERQLSADDGRPLFLSAHFCLPHWPYSWSETLEIPEFSGEPQAQNLAKRLYKYRQALAESDRQVGRLLSWLERHGYLENALVVLLSDHGEGLGRLEDSPSNDEALPLAVRRRYGHGTNIFSASQYQVFLAFKAFGRAGMFEAGSREQLAANYDLAPTLAEITGVSPGRGIDGLSLLPWLLEPQTARVERSVFMETGLHLPALESDAINVDALLRESSGFYTLNRRGQLILDPDVLPRIVAGKMRGVRSGGAVLGTVPDPLSGLPHDRLVYEMPDARRIVEITSANRDRACDSRCESLLELLVSFYGDELSLPANL